MKKTAYWFIALLVTLFFAVFQRATGPTYPIKGKNLDFAGAELLAYRLPRSCTVGGKDCLVNIKSADPMQGALSWKRLGADEPFSVIEMTYKNGWLSGWLPQQPPAGKLEYSVTLRRGGETMLLGPERIVTRFKGAVPGWILIPHVLLMFLFMVLSARIMIALFARDMELRHAVAWNTAFLVLGGFIFGPLTQYHAFGHYWTGWPFGYDLTDNKTLVLLLFWLAALWASFKAKNLKPWLIAAFIVTLLVYFIPHSIYGSQLDYTTGQVITGR
ncbi:MAG: hypothetical protein FD189_1342 [Elusimicrobia bacterium]|nr:MAG: hypothetical protein FD154_773 [Elusimicrobiota bacterium]KAF0155639.1 MAG: hypothetical protein FD189_1342 [Elusimicrobiota bacterium]